MATTAEPQPGTIAGRQSGPTQPLRPMEFERRALRPDDVRYRFVIDMSKGL
ncbi:MAG TPA: hypothetical protein VF470_00765 [Sphingomicrobium sp.]